MSEVDFTTKLWALTQAVEITKEASKSVGNTATIPDILETAYKKICEIQDRIKGDND